MLKRQHYFASMEEVVGRLITATASGALRPTFFCVLTCEKKDCNTSSAAHTSIATTVLENRITVTRVGSTEFTFPLPGAISDNLLEEKRQQGKRTRRVDEGREIVAHERETPSIPALAVPALPVSASTTVFTITPPSTTTSLSMMNIPRKFKFSAALSEKDKKAGFEDPWDVTWTVFDSLLRENMTHVLFTSSSSYDSQFLLTFSKKAFSSLFSCYSEYQWNTQIFAMSKRCVIGALSSSLTETPSKIESKTLPRTPPASETSSTKSYTSTKVSHASSTKGVSRTSSTKTKASRTSSKTVKKRKQRE